MWLCHAPGCAKTVFRILENKAKIEVGPLRMWLFFLIMAVAAHWAACCFYLASRMDAEPSRDWARQRADTTWGEVDGLWRTEGGVVKFLVPLGHRYSRAYYWALVTMITVGFGDITPQTRTETVVCIFSMYAGMSVSCLAIANLTNLVMSSNKESIEHRGRVDAIRQYGSYRHLPESTVRHMIEFVEHRWGELHGIDVAKFRKELPKSLLQRCVKLKVEGLLRRLPALRSGLVNDAFINSLALKLTTSNYAPRDQIIRPGERLVGAILIASGEIDVLSRQRDTTGNGLTLWSNGQLPFARTPSYNSTIAVHDAATSHRQSRDTRCVLPANDNVAKDSSLRGGKRSPRLSGRKHSSMRAVNEHVLVRLHEGDNFGLLSLFNVQQSRFLVEARSFCEVFWLPRATFISVCREQCTLEQFENMSLAIQAKSRSPLLAMLYAGFGLDLQRPYPSMRRRWASGGTILQQVSVNSRRITHGLTKVFPASSHITQSRWQPRTPGGSKVFPTEEEAPCALAHTVVEAANEAASERFSLQCSTRTSRKLTTSFIGSISPPWRLHFVPGSPARDLLEAVKLGVLIFYLITIPLAVKTVYSRAFIMRSRRDKSLSRESVSTLFGRKERMFAASYACDLAMLLDLVVRATVLPMVAKGVVVTRSAELRELLVKQRPLAFCVEASSLLPWDAFAIAFPMLLEDGNNGATRRLSTFALARVAKIGFLAVRLLPQVTLVLGSASTHLPLMSKQMQLIIKLNAAMIFACHWVGCFWMLVGRVSRRYYGARRRNSWITIDRFYNSTRLHDTASDREQLAARFDASAWNYYSCAASAQHSVCTYVRAVYFAIVAMSTVGYGDIKPDSSNLLETTFASSVILFGGLLLPSVIGGLASLMADLNKGVREFRARLSELYASMQRRRLSPGLQHALLQFNDYVWTRQKGVEEISVLACLPVPTRRAVLNQTIGFAFSSAPFFSREIGVEDVAREELVSRLEPRTFLPGDVILAEADLSRLSMFLIERGTVDLYAAKAGLKALEDARKRLVALIDASSIGLGMMSNCNLALTPLNRQRRSSLPNISPGSLKQTPVRERADQIFLSLKHSLTARRGACYPTSPRSGGDASPRFHTSTPTASRRTSVEVESSIEPEELHNHRPSLDEQTVTTNDSFPAAGKQRCVQSDLSGSDEERCGESRNLTIKPMLRVSIDLDEGSRIVGRDTDPPRRAKSTILARSPSKDVITETGNEAPSSISRGSLAALQESRRFVWASRNCVMRLSANLPTIKGPLNYDDRPVLKALCQPVMKRCAGDYFGAECLIETRQDDKTGIHWSHAIEYASSIVQQRKQGKRSANMSSSEQEDPPLSPSSTEPRTLGTGEFQSTPKFMRTVVEERKKRDLEAHMRLAPKMSTVATTHTECYELSRAQYFDVLKGFPSSAMVIRSELRAQCRAEHRRVANILSNIARLHFSTHSASLVKYADSDAYFSYLTATDDEICKLALCPETVSTLSDRDMRGSGSHLSGGSEGPGDSKYSIATTPGTSRHSAGNRTLRLSASLRTAPFWGRRWLRLSSLDQMASARRRESRDSYITRSLSLDSSSSRFFGIGRSPQRISELIADLSLRNRWLTSWLRRWYGNVRRNLCDPESRGAMLWSGVMVVVVTFHLFSTPLLVAFVPRVDVRRYALDWLCDALAVCDLVFQTYVIGYVQSGRLISDPRRIFRRQRESGALYSNLFVAMPYELLPIVFLRSPMTSNVAACRRAAVAWARLPKMMRVVRLNGLVYAARPLLDTFEARVGFRTATLVRLLGAVVLVSHLAACSFFGLARYRQLLAPVASSATPLQRRWRCTWIRRQVSQGFLRLKTGFGSIDSRKQYLRSLNWALPTLVVVVIGDVTPASCLETAFCFCCIALGMTVNAMIIGQVVAAVVNSDAASSELLMRADRLETFMQQHRVPFQLRRRINAFMSSLSMTTDQVDPITGTSSSKPLAQSTLPHPLRARVCAAVRLPVLARCPIFELCPEVVRRAIALHLTPDTYSSGDLVVQYGDRGEAMFFLSKGSVKVVAENGVTVYATLKAGSFFGEGALFSSIRRTASVKCACFSEALRLARYDVQTQLRAFCFDSQVLEDKFNLIALRNKLRNSALQVNLKNTSEPGHRLNKIVGLAQPVPAYSRTSSSRSFASTSHSPKSPIGETLEAIVAARIWWRHQLMKLHRLGDVEASPLVATWNSIALLLALYTAIRIPHRATFTLPGDLITVVPSHMLGDFACDTFFIVSLFLRYHTSLLNDALEYHVLDGTPLSVPKPAARSTRPYHRSRCFKVDVSAELPFELLVFFFQPSRSARAERNLILALRLNRLIRLARIGAYASKAATYATIRYGIRVSAAKTALLVVFLSYVMCNHWYACVWFAIHRYVEAESRQTWASADSLATRCSTCTQQSDDDRVCRISAVDCYLRSAYMVITTISSVGYGDITPVTPFETAWQLVVVTSGACLFASLIGAFTLWLEEIDTEGASAFNAKLQKYEAYMRRTNFPGVLRSAVVAHHQHRFEKMHCIDSEALTRELTAPLRMELYHFIHRAAFERIHVLCHLPLSTARRLADVMSTQVCLRNEHVYEAGEVGLDVYFIYSGAVSLRPPADDSVLDAYGRATFSYGSVADAERDHKNNLSSFSTFRGHLQHSERRHSATLISRTSLNAAITRRIAAENDSAALSLQGFSALVEADRLNMAPPENYRPVYGTLYQGDHFGEYCLQLNSGVRQETASAIKTLELYTVSSRDLEEKVLRYESDDVLAMLNDRLQIHRSVPPPPSP